MGHVPDHHVSRAHVTLASCPALPLRGLAPVHLHESPQDEERPSQILIQPLGPWGPQKSPRIGACE